jgi:hypothetical protein
MSILQLLGIRSNTGNPNRDNQILWYNKYNNRLVGLKGAKKEFLAWLSEPLSAGPLFVEGPSGCGKTRMVLTTEGFDYLHILDHIFTKRLKFMRMF